MTEHALVRPPSERFALGITTAGLGPPDLARALTQHAAYVAALEAAGVRVTALPEDDRFPDATFVEDTAVLTPRGAILTRPGAAARRGEVEAVGFALAAVMPILGTIEAPGLVDGGDVCETESRFLVGISARTNEEGASQLATLLALAGRRATIIRLRRIPGLLHLKTGLSYLGEGRLAVWEQLAGLDELRGFELLRVAADEGYAANAVRVVDRVLLAEGFPRTAEAIVRAGLAVDEVPMSEFRKMDGGLSCLSLRWSSP